VATSDKGKPDQSQERKATGLTSPYENRRWIHEIAGLQETDNKGRMSMLKASKLVIFIFTMACVSDVHAQVPPEIVSLFV